MSEEVEVFNNREYLIKDQCYKYVENKVTTKDDKFFAQNTDLIYIGKFSLYNEFTEHDASVFNFTYKTYNFENNNKLETSPKKNYYFLKCDCENDKAENTIEVNNKDIPKDITTANTENNTEDINIENTIDNSPKIDMLDTSNTINTQLLFYKDDNKIKAKIQNIDEQDPKIFFKSDKFNNIKNAVLNNAQITPIVEKESAPVIPIVEKDNASVTPNNTSEPIKQETAEELNVTPDINPVEKKSFLKKITPSFSFLKKKNNQNDNSVDSVTPSVTQNDQLAQKTDKKSWMPMPFGFGKKKDPPVQEKGGNKTRRIKNMKMNRSKTGRKKIYDKNTTKSGRKKIYKKSKKRLLNNNI